MSTTFLDKLNPAQREAATTVEGPLLIIAGAGSGKTTVLVNRLAYMVECRINPANILLLTFTNAAADNMKERAKKLGDGRCGDVTACTYHSFCAKELRQYAKKIGLNPNFTIISPAEASDAVRLAKTELGFSQMKGIPNNAAIVEIISKSVNTSRNISTVVEREFDKFTSFVPQINQIAEYFKQYKKAKGLCDYDDLLIFMDKALDNPDILNELQETYRYIMVDEYQDTNILQERIIMKLCKKYRNLCVVGDDYQSIYSFRGSDISNILEFPKRIGGCKQIVIATNYRSTKEVLDVANNVMGNYADFGYKKDMTDCGKKGLRVLLETTDDQSEEASFILRKIKKAKERGIPLSEIAVLFRSSFMTVDLELALNKEGIPFKKLGGIKFLDRTCVQDMLAFLRILVNPTDELAWYRILCLLPGIGDVYAGKIVKQRAEYPGSFAFLTAGYEKRSFYKYLTMLRDAVQTAGRCVQSEWVDLLSETYLFFRKEAIEVARFCDEGEREEAECALASDKTAVALLCELAKRYTSVSEFLDSIALDALASNDNDGDMLTLSTIHSAKGMEWNTVFVMDCADGVFPKYPEEFRNTLSFVSPEEAKDYYEELRCFYVALTRAKESLILTCPRYLMVNGKPVEGRPSHFLKYAIENELVRCRNSSSEMKKVYLFVPFSDKDTAKSIGARWDSERKRWYYLSNGENDRLFSRWR